MFHVERAISSVKKQKAAHKERLFYIELTASIRRRGWPPAGRWSR